MATGTTEPGSRSEAPRLALTHDWLTGFGGAERCLEVFAELWPDAPIFTSLYDSERFAGTFPPARVHPSGLQRMPGAIRRYRDYLPFMPAAFRSFDLAAYDTILASSHAFAKSVTLRRGQRLLCYCYTPIRYLWGELQQEYLATLPAHKRMALQAIAPGLRRQDYAAAQRVDQFIAISREVQTRIQEYYGRESVVVYPPVFTEQWRPVDAPARDYFLIVSRFVPYKRVELAVAACARLGLPLKVVGTGPEEAIVRAAAGGSAGIEFLGFVAEANLRTLYANARGLLFTAHEDFGLAPLEANATATPVLAYAGGGALETVVAGKTGEFFAAQTVDSLTEALAAFEPERYDPVGLRAHAESFGRAAFERRITELVGGRAE